MPTQTTHAGGRDAARFPPELTLGEARARLFALSGFPPDGGYGDSWVVLKLWRIPLAFPNTAGRRRAVRFHDLHHVLTEYRTDWRGEFEIAAWEIAGGVNRYWEGWILDLLGFACGRYSRAASARFARGSGSTRTKKRRGRRERTGARSCSGLPRASRLTRRRASYCSRRRSLSSGLRCGSGSRVRLNDESGAEWNVNHGDTEARLEEC